MWPIVALIKEILPTLHSFKIEVNNHMHNKYIIAMKPYTCNKNAYNSLNTVHFCLNKIQF